MFFNKLYKVEYWTTAVISRDNILTVVKARDMGHVVKKLRENIILILLELFLLKGLENKYVWK